MVKPAALACLLLAGLSLPGTCQGDSRAQKYYYEDISYPFFAPDPARPGWMTAVRPQSKPSSFPIAKSSDTFRVFVLGGSIAGLLKRNEPEADLERALQAALPGKRVEVMNCGMAGYDSYREALIEQEILEYAPDLIVFLTGHNEGIASAPIPIWIKRARERLDKLAAYRAFVKRLNLDLSKDAKVRDDAWADKRDAAFERNLESNLRHARERGVAAAVVVPPRNYREPAETPRSPYHPEFVAGWVRMLKGDDAGAIEAWKAALSSAPPAGSTSREHRGLAWSLIGRAEERRGRLAEARSAFEQASRHDRAGVCGALCQDLIRRAAAREGAFLVEADAALRARAFPRMPSMETFTDRMHWKPRFNCVVSAELIKAMRAQPKLSALPWDAARLPEIERACDKPGTFDDSRDDSHTLSYVLMGLSWPQFRTLSTVSVFYLQALRERRPSWFSDVRALMKMTENPQTQVYGLKMAPDEVVLPRFYWHVGEALMLDKDYAGAAKALAKALELDPKLPWARLSLAAAAGLRRDKKTAGAMLAQAAGAAGAERPEMAASAAIIARELKLGSAGALAELDPEHWIAKARAAADSGDREQGRRALERVWRTQPNEEQRRRLGQYARILRLDDDKELRELEAGFARARELLRGGDREAARAVLEAAAADPKREPRLRARVYHRKALLEREAGDLPAARESLARALELQPKAPASLRLLAEVELAQGRPDAALARAAELVEVSEADPAECAEALVFRASIQRARGDSEGARASLELALEQKPDHSAALQDLAAVQLAQERPAEAIATFGRLAESNRKLQPSLGARVYLYRAMLQRQLADLPGARESLERALELQPRETGSLRVLAELELAQSRPDAALALARRLVEASPAAEPAARAEALRFQASVQRAQGDAAGARATLERAIKLAPRDVAIRRQQAEAQLALARPRDALAILDGIAELLRDAGARERAALERDRARVQRDLGDEQGARESLERALEAWPGDPAALRDLVQLLAGEPERALAYAERLAVAARGEPPADRARLYREKAELERGLGKRRESAESLSRALALEPDFATLAALAALSEPRPALALVEAHRPGDPALRAAWLALRGETKLALGKESAGRRDLRDAVRLDARGACLNEALARDPNRLSLVFYDLCVESLPESAELRHARGVKRHTSGMEAAAIDDLNRAVALDAARLDAALSLASALSSAGRAAEALDVTERALRGSKEREGQVYARLVETRAALRESARRR